ncbi:MAG: protoporphyrinogen oxidase, partial [Candidatus Limnocylindria bacterium]|nr:protoporphyrinogen oxidase [Candidatus Limnocylindria bacterium]
LRRGMDSLVDALAARLGQTEIRLGVGLARLERSGPRYLAHLDDGTRIGADAVVLATPAGAAAHALADLAPAAADALATITYRGTVAVALAYDERRLARPLRGHGFLVPDGALAIAACTWSSAKWPDRAPRGTVLVRATIRSDALLAGDDDTLVDAAHRSLSRALAVTGRPVLAHVVRWAAAMPRYTVGHLERLARIEAALVPHPGIVLAGAAYRGTGVADCIAQGQAAAMRILAAERAAA